MAVYAYASSNATPLSNPSVPYVIDLEGGDAYPASITLYGAGEDTADPAATFTFQWTMIDPPGSSGDAPTLSGASTSTLTVTNLSAWRNYRFFLQVTSSGGGSSEASASAAKDQAFVTIQVKGLYSGLTKPAAGERNWQSIASEWVDEIDSLANEPPAHTIAFHSDTAATGAQLNTLVGGSFAESGNTALHQHRGDHIPVATTSLRGTVQLEESPGTDTPAVLVNERIVFSGSSDFSVDGAGAKVDYIQKQSVGVSLLPHVLFYVKEAITLSEYNVTLLDGGLSSVTTTFDLVTAADAAALNAGTLTAQNLTVQVSAASNYVPVTGSKTGLSVSLPAGSFFGIALSTSTNLNNEELRCLRVTAHATRKVIA